MSSFLRFRYLLLLLVFLLGGRSLHAQPSPVSIDWSDLADSTLAKSIQDEEVLGATVVVVNREETLYSASFGISHLDTKRPVTDSTLFQVGSIGKVLTAMAVLQQVERGQLDLSEDINTYLDDWQVDTPADTPLTLHHLLTHSGGLNGRIIGYAARQPEDVTPLGMHLATNLPPFFADPGRYISYSNYGFGLAGYAVEAATHTSFTAYVSQDILEPLNIQASGYTPQAEADLATGYFKQGDVFVPVPDLYRPVIPAGSFVANAQDMGKLLRALLNEGAPVLSPKSVEQMTEVQKNMHPALMGNSYGLEESRWGTIKGFGKGGSIPGFMAYMSLLPDQGLGMFVAVNGSSDAPIDQFVLAAMGQLSKGLGPVSLPSNPSNVSQFAGEYRNNRYDRTSLEKLLSLEIHNIYVTSDNNLTMWHDGTMNVYRPVGEKLFQHTEMPNRMLYFEVDDTGHTTHAFFNDRMAGGYVPVVWEKNGFLNSNKYVNEYFGIPLIMGLSYLFFPVIALIGWLMQRSNTKDKPHQQLSRWMNRVGFLTSALLLIYILFYFIPLLQSRASLVFGIPDVLTRWEMLPMFFMGGFALFAVLWGMSFWRAKAGRIGLAFGFFYLISGVLICEFCLRWNLI